MYDQTDFLEKYLKRRSRQDSPNNAIEDPIIQELIGDVKEKRVLDLGCGNGLFGKEVLEKGAAHYIGIEGSERMAERARTNLLNTSSEIICESMESYEYPSEGFDLVTSRFAIHYVADIQKLFEKVFYTLKENGQFVFSVQHPVTTSSFASKESGHRKTSWIVDDYFFEGERKEPWIQKTVVKYHRTVESYFTALRQAGFSVEELREGTPQRQHFSNEEEFERRRRIPLVLVFSCRK